MKMKVMTIHEVDAKETDTHGRYAYLVACCCGGVMEDPEIHYEDYQVIWADSVNEAERKYNELNKCSYYYGDVIRQLSW